ncbi:MAG: hypothetical protein PHH54_04505 [Candidatus Nanoarchaeia archaeon]|nr:hypothetical protein [Candidatus Nanoarchaeia archaeon]MDD5741220.1 hypothetical protein [Candidatus Nanoarchaeia archaeon]
MINQEAVAKSIEEGYQCLRELELLTEVFEVGKNVFSPVADHISIINQDLRVRGIPGLNSQDYLNKKIKILQEYKDYGERARLNEKGIKYLDKIIGLMEKIRNAGIGLPSEERIIW